MLVCVGVCLAECGSVNEVLKSRWFVAKHMCTCACTVVYLDVNECLENNGGCDSKRKCSNNNGGRGCGKCPSGWENDGLTGCKGL